MIVALPESERIELAIGEHANHALFFACLALSYAGLVLRCLIVGFVPGGTSGRNTTEQRAVHLNTSGAYSVVRHPLYVANFVILLGVTLSLLVW